MPSTSPNSPPGRSSPSWTANRGPGRRQAAVAVALRNRWRRRQLPEELRAQVMPKNIMLIGPTGVGKTEIARRLAILVGGSVRQDRSHQVHRGWLLRPRCREFDPRPRRGGDPLGPQCRTPDRRGTSKVARRAAALGLLLPSPPAPSWSDSDSPPRRGAERRERSREKMKTRLLAGELEDREIEVTIPGRSMARMSILGRAT